MRVNINGTHLMTTTPEPMARVGLNENRKTYTARNFWRVVSRLIVIAIVYDFDLIPKLVNMIAQAFYFVF